ncbi:MAG: DUF1963 domain-containing protein [Oligoflexia bacterium]|nr:DUF1963 domain-containing protein [Oligoflexia bacterium]
MLSSPITLNQINNFKFFRHCPPEIIRPGFILLPDFQNADDLTNISLKCRYGGLPSLPKGKENWPIGPTGVPLDFIGAINFSELFLQCPEWYPSNAPRKGILNFFYDLEKKVCGGKPSDKDFWKFIYVEDTNNLSHEISIPKGIKIDRNTCLMKPFENFTFPRSCEDAILNHTKNLESILKNFDLDVYLELGIEVEEDHIWTYEKLQRLSQYEHIFKQLFDQFPQALKKIKEPGITLDQMINTYLEEQQQRIEIETSEQKQKRLEADFRGYILSELDNLFANYNSYQSLLFGHACYQQGDSRYQAVEIEFGKKNQTREALLEWNLLWQIPSDKNTGLMLYDVGDLIILIKDTDLLQCNFDNIWIDVQSG